MPMWHRNPGDHPMNSIVRIVIPAVLAVASIGGAYAQTADKPAAQPQAQAPSNAARPDRGPSAETLQRLQDGKFAMAKTALKLTDAQAKLWQPVEDLIRKRQADRIKAMQDRQATRDANGVRPSMADRLDRMSTEMSKRAEETKAFAATFRPFYDSLSGSQKAVAGPLLAEFNGGHRMHGNRFAGRHGGPSQQ